MRPDSAWLAAGLACVAVAGTLRWSRASIAAAQEPALRRITQVLRSPEIDLDQAWTAVADVLAAAVGVLLVMSGVVLAASVLAAAVQRRLGPMRSGVARELGVGTVPQRLRIAVGGAVFVAILVAFDLQRRLAGAARAADATEDALGVLWFDGGTATLVAAGVAMIAAGAIDSWQQRNDQRLAVTPTPEQAADEARRSGGARR